MRIRGILAATMSIAALTLTACSSGDDAATDGPTVTLGSDTTTEATATGPADQTETGAEQGAIRVDVMADEFSLTLSEGEFSPGTYTFVLMNHGGAPHDLAIKGPNVDEKSAVVSGGGETELTVELTPGEYEVWCTVGNHRAQGMETTITVN